MAGTLHEEPRKIYDNILLNYSQSEKCRRETQNAHFMPNNFFSPENRAVYEISWKNTVESDRPQMTT